ncbi:hypothetical protein TWF703_010771 [Orbilia oligospora]|uniref:N-acetyltransferase domain-containing protein n=1 Tax=Orbilia oligospora TaxID=2813651 RepID=A0A7C8K3N2_ORBOL|nr:hypothetical protein TWF703_010771 [Orbilia oligospora]
MPFESTTPFIRRGTFRDPVFEESMSVRVEVFVNEQGVPAENERDDNHDRHAVDGISPENELSQNRTPVGTIRLIPPTISKKSYVLLGRLAVLKPFRKLGLARLLVEEALRYAASEGSAGGFDLPGEGIKWDGKCYVHAQTNVQGWWANNGFYRDDDAGEWDEEGIMHVGMWKDIALERRRSIINL